MFKADSPFLGNSEIISLVESMSEEQTCISYIDMDTPLKFTGGLGYF